MEVVYLDDVTGTIGEWIEEGFDEEIPAEIIELLKKAYDLAVKEMLKE